MQTFYLHSSGSGGRHGEWVSTPQCELSELNLSEASVHEVVMTSNLLTPTFIFVSAKTIF